MADNREEKTNEKESKPIPRTRYEVTGKMR